MRLNIEVTPDLFILGKNPLDNLNITIDNNEGFNAELNFDNLTINEISNDEDLMSTTEFAILKNKHQLNLNNLNQITENLKLN